MRPEGSGRNNIVHRERESSLSFHLTNTYPLLLVLAESTYVLPSAQVLYCVQRLLRSSLLLQRARGNGVRLPYRVGRERQACFSPFLPLHHTIMVDTYQYTPFI